MHMIPEILTIIFFATLLSYYFLLFYPGRKPKVTKKFKSITVIIPAHNEEEFIEQCVSSVLDAAWKGDKQVIVVDDGSRDRTAELVKKFKGVELIQTKHTGKSDSINRAMKQARGELIAIVDGDSEITKNSLMEMAEEVGRKNTAAATCVVRVKNRHKFLCMWPHLELVYNSLIRSIFAKINANITTPGPLSVYRKKELVDIGGFSTEGFSEDVDVTIRLIRKGYRIGFSDKTTSYTNMPYDIKGFFRQRTRFARGILNIFKRHMQVNNTVIDIYTLPLMLFIYVQAVIMGVFTIYQITNGYFTWFAANGDYFSMNVVRFFFEWASFWGFVKWTYTVLSGAVPLTIINAVGVFSSLLSYPLYFYSIFRYDRKFDLLHAFPLFLMAPFWWVIMIIQIISLPEMFAKSQYNIWKKNE